MIASDHPSGAADRFGITRSRVSQLRRRYECEWMACRSRRIDVAEFIEFCVGCRVAPATATNELKRIYSMPCRA